MNFSDFKTVRRWTLLNRLLQVVLAISLALGLNYLASRSGLHQRWLLAPAQSRTLSLETRNQLDYVGKLAPNTTDPAAPAWVTIYLTLAPAPTDSPEARSKAEFLLKRVRDLLDDVSFAAKQSGRGNWLSIEQTSLQHRANVFTNLQKRLPGVDAQSILVLTCKEERGKERYRVLTQTDLLTADPSGRPDPLFIGEEALTNALLGITNERRPILYAITGHREMSLADTNPDGLSQLGIRLRARNIETRPLDLTRVNEVPNDADLLLLAAPRAPLASSEVEKLRRYMRERNGRAIALINPGDPLGIPLLELFDEWGINTPDALIHEIASDATDTKGGLLTPILPGPHELMRATAGGRLAFAKARPAAVSPFTDKDATLRVTELSATPPNPPGTIHSWGETDHATPPYTYDPVRDIEAPLPVAIIAERSVNLPTAVERGGRLLVIGSGDIASNARLTHFDNNFFLLNSINWMLNQNQYLGIPPRSTAAYKLDATNADLSRIRLWFLLPPFLALFLGLLVFLWRRNT